MNEDTQEPLDETKIIPFSAKEVFDSLVPEPETAFMRVCREQKITPEAYNRQPRVTQVLNRLPGGFELVCEYLRSSEDPDAIKFMDVWDRIPLDDKETVGFEGICAIAGVPGKKLYGIIVAEATVEGENQMALLTAMMAPDVIKATLEMAKEPGGHRERTLVAKASGWLPRPKGTIINNGKISAGNTTTNIVALPGFDQDIRDLGERFQEMPVLPKQIEGEK